MEEEKYFDKFVEDLERREKIQKQHNEILQRAAEVWCQRRELDRRYREHTLQRTRYEK